ncbi:UvrD-helicase domain-containing protein [Streptomyces coeruleoprunus]|uniref:UvrD-helicase domain-containing protein n=1 Tax=Streptomyces coeruleoprunus TaxID=285563 RepID=A0ABV9XMZ6_9ACTN
MTTPEQTTLARAAAEAQQKAAMAVTAPAYVSACPGAGKTYVITSRHLQSPWRLLRQGRALISFTRVARDQMARRCRQAGRADLVQAPHFIGTLDSFLWEFLVKPRRAANPAPRLLESWASIKAPVEGMDREISLHRFPMAVDPSQKEACESVAWDKLDYDTRQLIEASAYSRKAWEEKIFETRKSWCDQGYFTGHEARFLALWNLRNAKAAAGLVPPLRSRFSEVIVDEAQDCSAADLAILQLLHAAGLPLILVGDPDQAIYAWRGAEPQALRSFSAQLSPTPHQLTGNWRSSPVICRLAATLRTGQRPPDTSVVRDDDIPVLLLPTQFANSGSRHLHAPTGAGIVDFFRTLTEEYAVPAKDCLVTAYKYATLPAISREKPNTSAITSLAWAHAAAHSPGASGDDLTRACAIAVRVLFGYWYPGETGGPDSIMAAHRLSAGQVNRTAFAFLHSLPPPHKEWGPQVWQAMKAWPALPGAAPQGGKGRPAGKPTVSRPQAATDMRTNIIHQLKGDEADGVLLLLPDAGSVQRWATSDPVTDEVLRVWYVAVTRARRLAAIAVPEEETDALAQLLTGRQVPVRVA